MNTNIIIPKPILQEIINRFFEAFVIISEDPNYSYIKFISDKKLHIVFNCLVSGLDEKFQKKLKYTIPSVDFIVSKCKLGFEAIKDYDGDVELFTLTHYDIIKH